MILLVLLSFLHLDVEIPWPLRCNFIVRTVEVGDTVTVVGKFQCH